MKWNFEGRKLDWAEWRRAMGLPTDPETYGKWLQSSRGSAAYDREMGYA